MSFLKAMGKGLRIALGILTGVGPAVAAVIPGTRDDDVIRRATDTLTQVGGVIIMTESLVGSVAGATGAQKLEAALPHVAQIIRTSEIMIGREIANEDAFVAAVRGITSNFADLLNSLKDKGVNVK